MQTINRERQIIVRSTELYLCVCFWTLEIVSRERKKSKWEKLTIRLLIRFALLFVYYLPISTTECVQFCLCLNCLWWWWWHEWNIRWKRGHHCLFFAALQLTQLVPTTPANVNWPLNEGHQHTHGNIMMSMRNEEDFATLKKCTKPWIATGSIEASWSMSPYNTIIEYLHLGVCVGYLVD